MVDITAAIAVDFAGALVGLKPDAALASLWAWHERVTSRTGFVA
jgi:hypothetical protein